VSDRLGLRRASVLLVDDRPANLLAFEAVLEPLEQRLVRAASGREALDRLAEEDFALILLDVQMPGMDGYETATRIRASSRNAETPIFFVTAIRGDPVEVERGYAVGAIDFVEKPVEPGILRAKVAAFLHLREKERALSESEERFRRAFDDAPIGMALVALDGRFLQVNSTLETLTGRDRAWLLGRTHQDLTHPDDLAANQALTRGLYDGARDRHRFEKRLAHAAGHNVWVSGNISLVRDSDGTPQYYVHQIEDVTDRKRAEDELARSALRDALTGLANRTLFNERLDLALARLRRLPAPLGVLFVDLDDFKSINERFGHRSGDRVLVEVAARLEAAFRPTDTVARLDGDSFCVMCDSLESELDMLAIAERVQACLAIPVLCDGVRLTVSASVGAAIADGPDADPEQLLRDADAAMFQARRGGRGRIRIFDAEMQGRAEALRFLKADLAVALERGEFTLYYQPKVDLATGLVIGVEALARWLRPGHGVVDPDRFIPIAEETGLIVPLGAWILEEACRQAARWSAELGAVPALGMAVNLSGVQLADPGLPALVAAVLERTGVDPALLGLEITETVLMEDTEANIDKLRALKAVGITLSVDDFGTGYSSLAYLKRFPVDVLKVDRAFVQGLPEDREDAAIVAAVIGLGHALDLTVVAEGVETVEQRDALRRGGCEVGQGYLFSRPQPAALLTQQLAAAVRRSRAASPLRRSGATRARVG
jgi:diguanylate cyclase (GGDEF)-like protein/PAS domain S-box-containing protein